MDLGRRLHPERPYDNPRVRVVADDARSFFQRTREKYDLIIFGLLDSHTLASSMANVRLDNYVYTVESFQEAKRRLRPGGVLTVVFEVTDEFIGKRIQRMLTRAFGRPPVGFHVPATFRGWGGVGFATGFFDIIQARLAADPYLKKMVDRQKPKTESWSKGEVIEATDDWPYLYLPARRVPNLFWFIYGVLIVLAVALRARVPDRKRIDLHFFFLGAGFLLLEVQNVSKLALLFGTTWFVNSIVIGAILMMIMAANYFTMRVKVASLRPAYVLLFLSLALNYFIPLSVYSGLGLGPKAVFSGAVMALPVFFAGIIFSTSFSRAEDRANVFSSNLLGAMVGGMLEAVSFIVGIKALLILAAILYLFSFFKGEGRRFTFSDSG